MSQLRIYAIVEYLRGVQSVAHQLS
jgi:hypothetical protein